MSEARFQVVRGAGFLCAVALALLLQRLRPHAGSSGSRRVNGVLWFANLIVVTTACGACAYGVAQWAAGAGFGLLNGARLPAWVGIPVAIAALDLVSYGWHRANHGIPLLWRFHQVHHSDPSVTASTGVRFHPGELLLSLPVRLTAVILVGASIEAVLLFEVAFTVANLLGHGDIDLPRRSERMLERLFITPALHRLHHSKVGPDRDKNFGTIFSAWDRGFGTYVENDSAATIETGLPGLEHVTLVRALMLPLQEPAA